MLDFRKVIQDGVRYLNPFTDFGPQDGKVEIRWDPLTGLTSRIVHFPVRKIGPFNFDDTISNSLKGRCPFCPDNIDAMTSKFDREQFGCERFEDDGVTVIPNLLSFDKYCLVAIISKEHFVDMDMLIRRRYLTRGIKALLKVLGVIKDFDKSVRYFSINCNYMPMSGSSILHPHIQAIAGEYPTNYHGLLLNKSKVFRNEHDSLFWDLLRDEEKSLNERFIGENGRTFWFTPFAPKGNIDLNCILGKNSIFELDHEDLSNLENGLDVILSFLDNEHVSGFNFSIFSGIPGEDYFRSNMRIVARRFLPPVNASDTNYFDKMHMESACLFFPEDVAKDARAVWHEEGNLTKTASAGIEGKV
jgi:UDPglucose--hexose-1-phosphate uridylyltransferase